MYVYYSSVRESFVTGNGMIRLFHLYRLNVQRFLGIYFYPFKIRFI